MRTLDLRLSPFSRVASLYRKLSSLLVLTTVIASCSSDWSSFEEGTAEDISEGSNWAVFIGDSVKTDVSDGFHGKLPLKRELTQETHRIRAGDTTDWRHSVEVEELPQEDPADVEPDVVLSCSADIVGVPALGVTGIELATAWQLPSWGEGMQYQVLSEDPVEMSSDRLSLELYYDGTWSPSGPASDKAHTFVFTGEDYSVCATCLIAGRGCLARRPESRPCEKEFLVQSGSLTIEQTGRSGDRLVGSLQDVVFVEVIIDRTRGTYVATPVPNGATWCIDEHRFDVLIEDI